MRSFEIARTDEPTRDVSSAKSVLQADSQNQTDGSKYTKLAQVDTSLPNIFGTVERQECSGNQVYDQIIDELYMRAFDVQSLGDKSKAKTKYNCSMKTDADGLKFADKFMKDSPDPHDDVLTQKEWERLTKQTAGTPRGIGIKLQVNLDESNRKLQNGPFLVEHVESGSKAELAGLKRGDKITKVDSMDSTDINAFNVENYIASHPNENIKFMVERNGESFEIDVEKAESERSAVRGHLDGDIAYIKIDTFLNENLSKDLEKLLEKFKDADAFVIDVRDNVGGHLSQGIEAATLFVDSGLILKTREKQRSKPSNPVFKEIQYGVTEDKYFEKSVDATGGVDTKFRARMADLVDKPVRILTNGFSASASEIFVGALQDNGDAQVVGVTTFGKGDGQTIKHGMPLGSALKYTSFRFYSPEGSWFGDGKNVRIGVKPDIVVANNPGTLRYSSQDTQYQIALKSIERELDASR